MSVAVVLGIAGTYCAGKSTIARALALHFNWEHLEVDKLGHEALKACKDRVLEAFGPEIKAPDGSIDRRALGRLVFAKGDMKAVLERIVHPWMHQELMHRMAQTNMSGFIINAALLYPMKLDLLCDTVIQIRAPFLTRLRRAMARDGLDREAALQRLRSQEGLLPKAPPPGADTLSVMNRHARMSLRVIIDELECRYGPEEDHFYRNHRLRGGDSFCRHRYVDPDAQSGTRPQG